MSNMEWLWLSDAEEFDPSALSVPEKLAKHGYACILNRMEAGKVQAAQLCVHDVLSKNENPNIAIICPERLIKSWYSSMLWDMGVEFKYFGVSPRSLNLYSDSMANYCLISAESVIKDGEKSVLFKAGEGFIWDLMFVDLPMPGDFDLKGFLKANKTKAKRLLISAFSADGFSGESNGDLQNLIKELLHRNRKEDKKAEIAIEVPGKPDGAVIAGRNMAGDYNLKIIRYNIDNGLISKAKRMDDAESGQPYKYGGNIFEEYNLEERKVYLSDEYGKKQLKTLVAADGKLEAFLKEIVALLSDHENRIVVYCASKQTVDYVSKALWACNGGKRGICVYGQSDADSEYIYGELSDTAGSEEPRIIVADDSAGVKFLNVERVTHIINYEYPENPAVLEQRFTRGGRKAGNPAFYIFCDEADHFDGRMLRNVVLSNIGLALGGAIPDKCLLFDIEGVEERLAALILELKYIIDTSKDAKADAVAGFRAEFNAPEADSAAKMAEVAKGRLQKLIELFDLHGSFKAKEIDGEKLFIQLTEKAAAFKGKRVFLDEKGALKLAAGDEPPKKAKPSEAANAAAVAKKLTGGEKDFSIIKSEIEKLSDSQKLSVLISIWKHYKYVKKLPKSYKSFIELYNKGVI